MSTHLYMEGHLNSQYLSENVNCIATRENITNLRVNYYSMQLLLDGTG